MKEQAESFHLNGHIIRFRPQTQKLESPCKTPSNTLAVKGLIAQNFKRNEKRTMDYVDGRTEQGNMSKTAGWRHEKIKS